MKLRDRMLELIEAQRPDLYKTLDLEAPDDAAIEAAYREALKAGSARAGERSAVWGSTSSELTKHRCPGPISALSETHRFDQAWIIASSAEVSRPPDQGGARRSRFSSGSG